MSLPDYGLEDLTEDPDEAYEDVLLADNDTFNDVRHALPQLFLPCRARRLFFCTQEAHDARTRHLPNTCPPLRPCPPVGHVW